MVEQRTPATLQVKTLIVIYYQADLQKCTICINDYIM